MAAKTTGGRKRHSGAKLVPTTNSGPVAVPASDPAQAGTPPQPFPIVGIGASAGGLAAFEAFFSGMPADVDPGMAFVLVQHLAPDHESILSGLIRRYTRMHVFDVEDGMVVQPNCAYIIPPNCDMAFLNGALQLIVPVAPRGQRLPIDFFFRSLAQDQHEQAIGIVLAGTGSDGTQGVRAIKGEGGMVMAQQPESTEYDGMPRSAIATGMVDYELPPAEMPAQLIAYAAHAFGKPRRAAIPPPPKAENALKKILILLRAQTGHDFSQYKPSTIYRRVERRMAVHQLQEIDGYTRYLRQTPAEVDALFHDLLIGVTSFFRDPEAFKAIEAQVIPKLFAGRSASAVIRVWVPGCSTGEEAYSIAILLAEHQEALRQRFRVQVFATDIDRHAIATARTGLYPASIAGDITPERLARFFTFGPDGAYRIHESIRDTLIFSEQDLARDPPFSRLDLISCRNLLIYMSGELQHKLMPLFHYALNPGGFLFLGTSETVGESADLFGALDRKAKLYQRQESFQHAPRPALGRLLPAIGAAESLSPPPSAAGPKRPPLRELTERTLLQQFAPAAALADARGNILYVHGRTGMYLEPAPGEAGTNNILKMAREGLRHDLSAALRKAAGTGETVFHPGVRVKTNGGFTAVNLTVHPLAGAPDERHEAPLYLVVLAEAPAGTARPALSDDAATAGDASVAALMQELRAKEEYLQTANEELQSSTEELKSANEEMQSVNEELQSTNEELETAKEEMQSINEELATTNAELQTKVTDLSRVNSDMTNLLAGSGIATVFVDLQLRILRYTPAATQIINLIPTDVGRPVGHIVANLVSYDGLAADARAVLDTLIPREVEVQTVAGQWYALRLLPYRTLDNVIEGVVITFVAITELVRARETLRQANALLRLAAAVRDARDAMTVQDLDGRIIAWNPGAERLYGWSEAEALTMNVSERVPAALREDALRTLRQLSSLTTALEPYRTQRLHKNGTAVEVWITATALLDEAGKVYAITTTERA